MPAAPTSTGTGAHCFDRAHPAGPDGRIECGYHRYEDADDDGGDEGEEGEAELGDLESKSRPEEVDERPGHPVTEEHPATEPSSPRSTDSIITERLIMARVEPNAPQHPEAPGYVPAPSSRAR